MIKKILMNYTQLKVEEKNQVVWIRLNRPDKMNALTAEMMEQWVHALEATKENENCKVIVVTGEGRAFSAGIDLTMFQKASKETGLKMHKDGLRIMQLLETLPVPTIAMVNGFCFTGAMELLMAFDLIYTADEAKIGDTHAKWGIKPNWGMTQRLQHQVGLRKAKEMSFTAQPISGKEAERIGLANKSVPLSDLQKTVDEVTAQIIENSSQTIAGVKTMYEFGSKHTLKEGIQFEHDYQFETSDKKENLENFKKNI